MNNKRVNPRPRILTFVRYYLPGYKSGGPIRTIANMVWHLGSIFHFLIITSDRDALDTMPYPDISVNRWNRVEKADVFYLSPDGLSVRNIANLIRKTPHDIMYLNSFFDPVFTIIPLVIRRLGLVPKRPTVIAPRGELSLGALDLKTWKKRPYMFLGSICGFYENLLWQASSEYEVMDIKKSFGEVAREIYVAPNLPPPIVEFSEYEFIERQTSSVIRIVFLSRITPMKNLHFALKVLKRVHIPVEFAIYGPIRDMDYWRKCQKLIKELPENITVRYHGSLHPQYVQKILASYELFFLPTRGENFGHAILEALSVGTPVLISNRTRWPHDPRGGCIALPLQDESIFSEAIENFARLSLEERESRRLAARAIAESFIRDDQLIEKNHKLFTEALKRSRISS